MTEVAQPPAAGRPRSMGSRLFELSRHTAIYGIGGLTSRFLAVLMLPLYTSYVSVGDYGRIELLMSLMYVAVVVIRGGANFGFIRFYFLDKQPEYRRRLIRTVFWAQMGYSTLALAFCILFASEISNVLNVNWRPGLQGSGTSLVIATAVLLWVSVNYAQMTNMFRAEKRSVAFTIATLLNIGITVPLTVILVVVYKQGPLGIIVGNLSGTLVVFIALLGYRREQLGLQFDRKLLHAMNRFGLPLMGAALATWVLNFGDRLMLARLLHGTYALNQVGQYALAIKISGAMVLLFTAFQVAWPAFAYSIEDEGEAKRTYSFVLTYLMAIAAWTAVGLSLFAPWIVRLLAPRNPHYWPAAEAIPALSYASVFFAGFIVVTIATGRSRQTQFNWIATSAGAVLNFTLNLWLIPTYGMLGAAYATLAGYILIMVLRTWNAQRVYPVRYQWRRVIVLVLVAGALTGLGKAMPHSIALACVLTVAYPLVLAAFGFYLPAERKRLRRLLPAHN